MEANARWVAVTAVAPITWGTTYYVTQHTLPADLPLYGAAFRALPAGLLLFAITRAVPQGSWWWRSAVLGVINFAAFFALVYVAAQLLPASIASTLMATSSLMMMLIAWPLLGTRPHFLAALGALTGIGGVAVMLLGDAAAIDLRGVLASLAAMLLSCVGHLLTKRWSPDVSILAMTSWQLIAGGLVMLTLAVVFEGALPHFTGQLLAGYGYVTFVATAVAFVAWFQGLRHLDAGTVGLVGLLNPVAGVLLGVLLGSEPFGARQVCGVLLVLAGILMGQPIARKLLSDNKLWTAKAGRASLAATASGQCRPSTTPIPDR